MDELLSPSSSSYSPPSPSSFFSASGNAVLEFMACEVPEQWLVGDDLVVDVLGKPEDGSDLSEPPASLRATTERGVKKRGRQAGPRTDGPTVSHVEAERQRREKLNRRFCDLRAAVPTVSRMDKASLFADAAGYIAELRARVALLEAEARKAAAAATGARWEPTVAASQALWGNEAIEVRMVGRDAAALRVTTTARHAPARLMCALRSLELQVQHACVSRVHGVTVQDVVVDVPAALQDDAGLRATLLQTMQESGR